MSVSTEQIRPINKEATDDGQPTTDTQRNSLYLRLGLLLLWILLAGLLLYKPALASLISAVIHREGSSHGVFVPFLSAFFLWTKRNAIRDTEPRYDYLGIFLVAIGAIFPIFSIGTYHVQILSFIVLIAGLIIIHLGRKLFKEISFPLLFLIAMIPVPGGFYLLLTNCLRDLTFGASSWVISLFGIPFYKEGVLIHLPNTVLNISTGCSGIRYLISFFVFGFAYAYLYRETLRSRLIIIGLTIPISVAASICRLTAIFLLTYIFGPRMAEYWPHVFISWAVFFAILILSIASDRFFHTRYVETTA